MQSCALAAASNGPCWHITFLIKSYAGYPGFHKFRALGHLQFLLEDSLVLPVRYCVAQHKVKENLSVHNT